VKVVANSNTAIYSVDAMGRRITTTVNGGTPTNLYYSNQWQVLEEQVNSAMTAQYVWSPMYVDALVERDSGGQRLYAQQDANWNVTAVVGFNVNVWQVMERYAYDPYGKPSIYDPSWNNRTSSLFSWVYLHQGGRFDPTSGLYNFRNRDLSPTLGRWMEQDPAGYAAGDNNLYGDEGEAPTDTVDPYGTEGVNRVLQQLQREDELLALSQAERAQKQYERNLIRAQRLHLQQDEVGSYVVNALGSLLMPSTFPRLQGSTPDETARIMTRLQNQGIYDPLLNPFAGPEARERALAQKLPGIVGDVAFLSLNVFAAEGTITRLGGLELFAPPSVPTGAFSGGYVGRALTQAEVDAITAEFRAAGGVVDQSVEAEAYLQLRGAGGLTLNDKTILLPANPTRTAVFEELIHAGQFSRGATIEAGSGGVLRFEAEAAETLIRNRNTLQLPRDEVRQVIDNLRRIRGELQTIGLPQ